MLTLTICSPLSTVQVTILSSNGTDITPSIQILHSSEPISTLHQRSQDFYPLSACPTNDVYTSQSWCQRAISPRAFVALCKEVPDAGRPNAREYTHFTEGACHDDDICVGNDFNEDGPLQQGFCVTTNHFVQIGHEQPPNGQNAGSSASVAANFNAAFSTGFGRHLAVQALVTNVDKRTTVQANSIVIQAQTHDSVWRTEVNGTSYCLRCSSETLAPFPKTAQRIKVDVGMPKGVSTGLLWLASYSY